jgi:hypothetical protein
MFLAILAGSLVLQAWAWRHLRRRIASGDITRLGGSVRYGVWAAAPFFFCVGVFLGAVGIEEWSGGAIIPESLGRAALPIGALLLGLAFIGWISFTISSALIRRRPGTKP